MVTAMTLLTTLTRGGAPDTAGTKDAESTDALEAAISKAQADLEAAIGSTAIDKVVAFPRGPKGPFEAPAVAVFLQALTHGQHHRGQNASRMRQLGVTPPMTDFIVWVALGRP